MFPHIRFRELFSSTVFIITDVKKKNQIIYIYPYAR
uniref:Uncharacterized protein n=1 Tax=Lepeophtheirus salmonis TaxID=72036 RepID=A0A0K2TM05_LEPSM